MRFATSRSSSAPTPRGRAPSLSEGTIDPEVIQLIPRDVALSEGMTSLRQDAVRKVVAGQTTPEEILRAVYLEE